MGFPVADQWFPSTRDLEDRDTPPLSFYQSPVFQSIQIETYFVGKETSQRYILELPRI